MNILFHLFHRHSKILLLLVTVAILILTLMPSDRLFESKLWNHDKLGHAVAFGSWAFCFGAVYTKQWGLSKVVLVGLGATFVFGLAIEMLQFVLPINRGAEFLDLLADVLGGILALYLYKWMYKTFHI